MTATPAGPTDIDSREHLEGPVCVSPGALYRLLREEFERVRPRTCNACKVPVPLPTPRTDANGPNWALSEVRPCEVGCDITIASIFRQVAQRYRMVELSGSPEAAAP
jgi:hypothetical protein